MQNEQQASKGETASAPDNAQEQETYGGGVRPVDAEHKRLLEVFGVPKDSTPDNAQTKIEWDKNADGSTANVGTVHHARTNQSDLCPKCGIKRKDHFWSTFADCEVSIRAEAIKNAQSQVTPPKQPIQTTATPLIARNVANCIHCNSQFPMTDYKLRKHYKVCDSCIKQRAQARSVPHPVASQSWSKAKAQIKAQQQAQRQAQAQAETPNVETIVEKIGKATKGKKTIDASADYIPQNGEVDDLKLNIECGINTLLTGPTQCGKTTLSNFVAKQLGREIVTIQGGAGISVERIVAKDALIEENGVTITVRPSANNPSTWSVLPNAMQRGAILYIDEPNMIPDDVLAFLFPAMDWRHELTFEDGTTLKAKEGFVCICAMNEGQGYGGTSLLNNAFRARSRAVIDLDYLPKARESALVIDRTGIDKANADKLCDAVYSLRQSLKAKTIQTPIGTSAVLACAMLLKRGQTLAKAVRMTIINQVPSTKDKERLAVEDVLSAYFGKEIK